MLRAHGMEVCRFSVVDEPTIEVVTHGVALAKKERVDIEPAKHVRTLTAEGWKRNMMKKKTEKTK